MVSLKFWKRKAKNADVGFGNVGNLPAEFSPKVNLNAGEANVENVKAKMDLVLTQIQSLNVRYETFNERLDRIEKMIAEIYRIAKA